MALQLNPYITFDGTCAEAMEFYATALGGSVQLMSFRDAGMDLDGIMHAHVSTPAGFHLFACDFADGMGSYQPGTNLQISLSGDEADALKGYWAALAEGGQVIIPLQRQVWGDDYGQLADRFGILWHVNIAGTQA